MPHSLLDRTLESLANPASHSPHRVVLVGAAAWLAIAVADWLTSYELSLNPLYIIVFCLVTWHAGWRYGLALAVLSILNQVSIGVVLGHPFSRPAYFAVTNMNKLFSAAVMVALVARLRLVHARERTHARLDYLTGALNNMGFCEALGVELARHRREEAPFALAYIDCDDFKDINDRMGHRNGDALLRIIVDTLKRALRKTDIIARLGGDEFAVLLPKTAMPQAQSVVEQLIDALHMAAAAQDFNVTFSVGVGIFELPPLNEDDVLTFSDRLMYRVKAAGKNNALYESYPTEGLRVVQHGTQATAA